MELTRKQRQSVLVLLGVLAVVLVATFLVALLNGGPFFDFVEFVSEFVILAVGMTFWVLSLILARNHAMHWRYVVLSILFGLVVVVHFWRFINGGLPC